MKRVVLLLHVWIYSPDRVLPAAAGGWTSQCLLQETRGTVLSGREDGVHLGGPAAAPEVLEGPVSESQLSDLGLEWPPLAWRLEREHLSAKKIQFLLSQPMKSTFKVHPESTYWCCRYHDNQPWQQSWEDHFETKRTGVSLTVSVKAVSDARSELQMWWNAARCSLDLCTDHRQKQPMRKQTWQR